MKQLLKETNKCELCGSKRGLEVHHIIPVTCGGPENDIDNMIVLCIGCHARLTPRKILQKIGIENCLHEDSICRINKNFYELIEKENCIGASEVVDIFNRCMWEEVRRIKKRYEIRGKKGRFYDLPCPEQPLTIPTEVLQDR